MMGGGGRVHNLGGEGDVRVSGQLWGGGHAGLLNCGVFSSSEGNEPLLVVSNVL